MRPLDQCHIFIQPHLLEWDDVFNSPAVLVALRETPMELHVYDHEARFQDFLNQIVIVNLRFHSLVVADIYYDDFEKLISLKRDKYNLIEY